MVQVQVEVPYKKNYDIGIGVDLMTGSPMGKVVEGEVSGVTAAGGAVTSFDILRLNTTEDLERALGLSVEASGGCGCFSASGRMDYVKKSKVQTSSLFMAITAYITLENLSIDDPSMTPQAVDVSGRADAFDTRYGNMFVRGIGRGGLFVAVLQINTQSSEESESISAQLGGSYGLFSAKAKSTFEEIQKKYQSELKISVYHEGGPIDLSMDKDKIDDANELYMMLQNWLRAFQNDPSSNAVPYSATLASIAIANGPLPPNAADTQHAQDILVLCAKQRSQIMDGMNLMDFILQNPSRYDFIAPTTQDDVVKAFAGYQSDLDVVAAAASHAIDHVAEALTPAEFALKIGKVYPLGVRPSPMPTMQKGLTDSYAMKGDVLTKEDPLATMLRDKEVSPAGIRGFNIGMAVAEGQTLPGPGKDKFRDGLPADEQPGFNSAVAFTLERNRNKERAVLGARIAALVPAVASARANPSVFYMLGFDIATATFGDPALGAQGNTATGPGSLARRDALVSLDAQRGFNDAVKLFIGPPPLPRQS